MKLFVTSALSIALASTACGSSSSGGDQPAGTPGTFQQESAKQSLAQSVSSLSGIKAGGSGTQGAAISLLANATSYQGFVTPAAGGAPASERLGSSSAALGTCDCKDTTCTFMDCGDDPNSKMTGTTSVTGDHVVIDLHLVTTEGTDTVTIAMKCDLMLPATGITGGCTTSGDVKTDAGGMSIDVTFDTSATYAVQLKNGAPSGGSIDVTSSSTYAGQTYTGAGKVSFP